jgi:hypothetical protein
LAVNRQSQNNSDSELLVESVEGCNCEKWEAGRSSQGQFGNQEEEERPMLEAATKQRL